MPFNIPNLPASPTAEQTSQSQVDSLDFSALAAGSSNTGVVSGCLVTQHTGSDLQMSVAAGVVCIKGQLVTCPAVTTTALTAPSGNPAFAFVVATAAGVTLAPIVGPAAVSPAFPSVAGLTSILPTAVLLAAVYLANGTTAITNADIIDKRVFVADGDQIARPSALRTTTASTLPAGTRVAVVDGTNHPLSEIYATLGAAQTDFPFVTSTTQSRDWCAIQAAFLGTNRAVFLGPGTWWCSHTLIGPSTDLHLWGAGEGITSIASNASGWVGGVADVNLGGKVFCWADGLRIIAPLNSGWEGIAHIHDIGIKMLQSGSQVGACIDIIGSGVSHIDHCLLAGGTGGVIWDQCEVMSINTCAIEGPIAAPGAGIWAVDGSDHLPTSYIYNVNATGGSFTVSWLGQSSAAINWNDTTATMQTKIAAISTVGAGNVSVFSNSGGLINLTAGPVNVSMGGTAPVTLTGGVTAGQTTIPVSSFSGYPVAGNYNMQIGAEFLTVTGGQGTLTWTVTRGALGSTAVSHPSGVPVVPALGGTNSLTGGTATTGAQGMLGTFTNTTTISDCQFSPGAAVPCIVHDGGVVFHVKGCNFNGGLWSMYLAGIDGVVIEACESESQSGSGGAFITTSNSAFISGLGVGAVRNLTMIGCEAVGNSISQSAVDLSGCQSFTSINNFYLGYAAGGGLPVITNVDSCAAFTSIADTLNSGVGGFTAAGKYATLDTRIQSPEGYGLLTKGLSYYTGLQRIVNAGSAFTIGSYLGSWCRILLTGNGGTNSITGAPSVGDPFTTLLTVSFVQDGTGSRTYSWPTNARFAANTAPVASTGANRMDSVTFVGDPTSSGIWLEVSRAINVPVV